MRRIQDERQAQERRPALSPLQERMLAGFGMPTRAPQGTRITALESSFLPQEESSPLRRLLIVLAIVADVLKTPYRVLHWSAKLSEFFSLMGLMYAEHHEGRMAVAQINPNNSVITRFLALLAKISLFPTRHLLKLAHFICQATVSPVKNLRIAYAYVTQHSEAEVKAAVHYDPVTDTLTVPPVAIDRNAEQTRAFHMALLSLLTTVIFGSLTFYYLPPLAKIVLLASVVAHVSGIGLEKLIPTLKAALSAYAQSKPQQNQPLESEVSNTHASRRVEELVEDLDEAHRATQQAAAVVTATGERAENDDEQRAAARPAPAEAEAPRVVQRLRRDLVIDDADQFMAGW